MSIKKVEWRPYYKITAALVAGHDVTIELNDLILSFLISLIFLALIVTYNALNFLYKVNEKREK